MLCYEVRRLRWAPTFLTNSSCATLCPLTHTGCYPFPRVPWNQNKRRVKIIDLWRSSVTEVPTHWPLAGWDSHAYTFLPLWFFQKFLYRHCCSEFAVIRYLFFREPTDSKFIICSRVQFYSNSTSLCCLCSQADRRQIRNIAAAAAGWNELRFVVGS